MTEVNYNGKEELLMADYEGISDSDLSSKYANTDFDITDAPSTYITNTQMTYALTCRRLFPAGDTYICNDEGTYKKGHTYTIKVNGATKSWEDITPSGGGITVLNATTDFPLSADVLAKVKANPQNYAILGKQNGEIYNTLYYYSQTGYNVLTYKNNPLENNMSNNKIGGNYYGIDNDGTLGRYTAPDLISLDTKSITRNPSYQGNMTYIRAIALYDKTNNTYVSAEDLKGNAKTIIDYATLESDTNLQKTVFENPDNYAIKTTVNLSGSDANVLCFPATSPENGTSGYTLKYFASYPVGVYGNDTASVAIALMKNDGSEDITLLNVPLTYQQKLTAGEGITIDGSTIKSTGVPERVRQGDDLNYNYTDFIRNATEIHLTSKSHSENADKEQTDSSNSLRLSTSDASISSDRLDTTSGNNVKFSSTIRLIEGEPRIEQQEYDAITGKEKSYIAIKGNAGKTFHYVKSQNEPIDNTNEIAVKKDIIGIEETIDNAIATHNSSETAHQDIRNLITGKQDQLSQEQLDAVNSGIDSTKVAQIETNKNNIIAINEKIPSQASSINQLADKNFVNSSINNVAAYYITYNAQGEAFPTRAALTNATTFYSGGEVRTPTRNDYCIVRDDETQDNATTRYSYQNNQWEFQYVVNETPMTAAQVAAINSGITNVLVAQITTNQNDITALQSGKQNVLTAGTNITIDSNNVISASGGSKNYMHSVKIVGVALNKHIEVYFNKLSRISTVATDLSSLQILIGDDVLAASGYFVSSIKINAGVSTITQTCNLPVLTISKTTITINHLIPADANNLLISLPNDVMNLAVTDNVTIY